MTKQVTAVATAGVDDETGEYFLDLELAGQKLGGLVLGKDYSEIVDKALAFAFLQRKKADEAKERFDGPEGAVPDSAPDES